MEVIVTVVHAANTFIVLKELVKVHDAISFLGVPLRNEVLVDVIFTSTSCQHVRVRRNVNTLSKVFECHASILVHV